MSSRPGAAGGPLPEARSAAMVALGLGLLMLLLFFPHLRYDALHYYELPRSVVFDGDMNGVNERASFTTPLWNPGVPPGGAGMLSFMSHPEFTARGYRFPFFPVGYPLLLLPPTLAGAAIERILPESAPGDGYSLPTRILLGYWTILAGAAAAGLALRIVWRMYPGLPSLAAALLVLLGTNLPAYLFVDPVYSHGFDFLVVTLFFAVWLATRTRSYAGGSTQPWGDLALGLLGGFAVTFRYQNVFLLGVPLVDALMDGFGEPGPRRALRRLGRVGAGALLAFLPQAALWRAYHGVWVAGPSLTGAGGIPTFDPFRPQLLRLLLSRGHGLLTWTPLVAPALLGIPLVLRRHRRLGLHLLWTTAIQLYYDACRSEWWNLGFGVRRTAGYSLLLVLGLAALLQALTRWPRFRRLLLLVGAGLVLWNYLFLTQFYMGPNIYQQGAVYPSLVGSWHPHGPALLGLPLPGLEDLREMMAGVPGFLRHRTLMGVILLAPKGSTIPGLLAGALLLILLPLPPGLLLIRIARGRPLGSPRRWASAGAALLLVSALGILGLDLGARRVRLIAPDGTVGPEIPLGRRADLPPWGEAVEISPVPRAIDLPGKGEGRLELALDPVPAGSGAALEVQLLPGGSLRTFPMTPTPSGTPRIRIDLPAGTRAARLSVTTGRATLRGLGLAREGKGG